MFSVLPTIGRTGCNGPINLSWNYFPSNNFNYSVNIEVSYLLINCIHDSTEYL